MKVVVTGGAGFIGSHLVDALIARNDEVTVIDDLSRGVRGRVAAEARFEQMDIGSAAAAALIAEIAPEVVLHHAAQIDVRVSVRDPLADTRANVVGTVNLLHACATAGVRRVIFASSGGTVYGDAEVVPTPESAPLAPTSPYGAAKVTAEVYGNMYRRLTGLEFVALRYANVYGPRQDPHGEAGVVAIFTLKLLRGEPTVINGDGLQTRDYVYVGDVVTANLAAIAGPQGGYNVGTGEELNVVQLHQELARACGVSSDPVHADAKAGEQMRSCLDASLAGSALNWQARTDLKTGIEATVAHFRTTNLQPARS